MFLVIATLVMIAVPMLVFTGAMLLSVNSSVKFKALTFGSQATMRSSLLGRKTTTPQLKLGLKVVAATILQAMLTLVGVTSLLLSSPTMESKV